MTTSPKLAPQRTQAEQAADCLLAAGCQRHDSVHATTELGAAQVHATLAVAEQLQKLTRMIERFDGAWVAEPTEDNGPVIFRLAPF